MTLLALHATYIYATYIYATLRSVRMGITSKHSPLVLKSNVSLHFVTMGTTQGLSNGFDRKMLAIPEKVE